ncbi:hypothetical protein CFIMG_005787RAa [Ceratocystis fimbriata CBS 114723]|uniref:Uncharacterized protein n=1 Tax=Ceratocystis fimbriata CBS 114723 TaxID=1035309 RepID=A0A2C5WUM2_9PEZI|nr:hypothetical protein CFIMG_005787RAa [Ceratocystis fimbriata CBS 114723]
MGMRSRDGHDVDDIYARTEEQFHNTTQTQRSLILATHKTSPIQAPMEKEIKKKTSLSRKKQQSQVQNHIHNPKTR